MTNNTHPPTSGKRGRNREERRLPGRFMPVLAYTVEPLVSP